MRYFDLVLFQKTGIVFGVSLCSMRMDDVTNAANALDSKNRDATVRLIDLKVEDDMEKVLNKIQHEFALMNGRLEYIDAKFEGKFEHMDAKFGHVESKISMGYTVFGIACGVIAVLLAALGIMIALK